MNRNKRPSDLDWRARLRNAGNSARRWARASGQWTARNRWIFGVLALVAVGLVAAAAGSAASAWTRACLGGCPSADQVADFEPAQFSEVYDANGDPIGTFTRERRRVIALDDLPSHVPLAFVAIEDQRFFEHEGIDIRRMFGAVRDNLFGGFGATGGSTITMQLARNLFPQHLPRGETSIRRKVAEMRLALDMERNFSKSHILELYLNNINLGAGAYGVEAAARTYFGKPAAELDYLEAATLAGLPQAPSRYNPRRNPERAEQRRNRVLAFMASTGVITAEQWEEGREREIALVAPSGALRAPHFVEHVRRELERQFGELLYTGGLRIHTTLDPELQSAAEEHLEEQLAGIEAGRYGPYRHTSYAGYITQLEEEEGEVVRERGPSPYLQGIAAVMHPHTGHVLAMVGGRDFRHSQFNRATQARRQSGSAFKPFIYAAAMERGRSPLYRVSDEPIHMALPEGRTWSPRNYGGDYGGMTTLRVGMQRSRNMVAIRLGEEVGLDAVLATAERMGVRSPIPRYPSAFIGAGDVFPLELITAYAAFANGGSRITPQFVTRIEDHEGRLLWEPRNPPLPAIDPGAAWLTTQMMREVVDGGTGYAVRNPQIGGLPYSVPAAGKTGTTNNNTDVWFVGYTPDLVAGVWLGMDRPQSIMPRATGGVLAAPVWARIMRSWYETHEHPEAWEQPSGVVTRPVLSWSGELARNGCRYARGSTDFFLASAMGEPSCERPPRRTFRREDGDPTPGLLGEPVFPDDEEPSTPRFNDDG